MQTRRLPSHQQHRYRVEVGGERIRTDPQRLKGDRTAAGEGVHHERPGARLAAEGNVGGPGQGPGGREVALVGGVVPVRKVGDEVQERPPEHREVGEIVVGRIKRIPEPVHLLRGGDDELLRAERVGRVRPERRAEHRPAGGERPARPPDVERGDVAVADGFLAPGMFGYLFYWKVDFDESFGVGISHHYSRSDSAILL